MSFFWNRWKFVCSLDSLSSTSRNAVWISEFYYSAAASPCSSRDSVGVGAEEPVKAHIAPSNKVATIVNTPKQHLRPTAKSTTPGKNVPVIGWAESESLERLVMIVAIIHSTDLIVQSNFVWREELFPFNNVIMVHFQTTRARWRGLTASNGRCDHWWVLAQSHLPDNWGDWPGHTAAAATIWFAWYNRTAAAECAKCKWTCCWQGCT